MYRRSVALLISVLSVCAGCGALGELVRPTDPAGTREIPPFNVAPRDPAAAHEYFIAIGDMGTGRRDQHRVAAAMAARAGVDGLDFIVTVGDNIYPGGVRSADDRQWESKFEEVYADPSLQVPVYPTLGNHDHRGRIAAQVEYSERNPNWRMPAPYYTFMRHLPDGTRVHFFALDTTPINARSADAEVQLAWLDEQLGESRADWKIVFGHHPLYGHNPCRGHNETMIASLEPLFSRHQVDLYLAGHDHTLEMLKPIAGVNYVITGAGGGPDMAYPVEWTDESYYAATGGGFTLLRVSKNEIIIEFVRMDAETQYAYTLSKVD